MLHQKVLELQRRVGSSPIHKAKNFAQVENIRAMADENSRLIKAYHCIWGEPDDYGTVWHKGSWSKSINDRGPASNARYKITTVYMHDLCDPLCVPSVIKEDDIGAYAEWTPDEGVPSADRTVIQVRKGTINNFSFGFNYYWDENSIMYDDKDGLLHIYNAEILELSPITIGSQKDTFAVRGANGDYEDPTLIEDTEDFFKSGCVPRKHQLELRQLIDRHISLASNRPPELIKRKASVKKKPTEAGIELNYITNNL